MLTTNLIVVLIILLFYNIHGTDVEAGERIRIRQNDQKKLKGFNVVMKRLLNLGKPAMLSLRNNFKLTRSSVDQVCYDEIGCFDLPRNSLTFKKTPDPPEILNTKFYLFRRDCRNFSDPTELNYLNRTEILNSKFDPLMPSKVVIHGYMSSWKDKGELDGVDAYLKIDNYNVILVDWEIGARGPHYSTAAANTEIVGRQLGILLMNLVKIGQVPKDIHLIGFSLGAHIAGCASEYLKQNGLLIGRITGLDPASLLFKHHLVTEKEKKLDASDARFVDVIHTDGSPIFTDGFGLLEPIGHVDFFPNGGREQPGCNDGRGSVVVSHFDKGLNRDIACSHIRAWRYYLETLKNKASEENDTCQFIAYPCKLGSINFSHGKCFPTITDKGSQFGMLGEDANGYGPMYLVTRKTSPYCGTQLQALVSVSQKTLPTRGILQLQIIHGNHTTNFQINCELLDIIPVGHVMQGLAAAEYGTIDFQKNSKILANLNYQSLEFQASNQNHTVLSRNLVLDKIQVRDIYGNSWQYCGNGTEVIDKKGEMFEVLTVYLTNQNC